VIQDGVQDVRRTFTSNIIICVCLWSDEFVVFTWVFGVKESIEIIFSVKKVASKGEFQDGRRALSASLSRFIIEQA